MNSPKNSIRSLLPIVALLFAGSCDNTDTLFIDQIGTVKIFPVSPSLSRQTIKDPGLTVQKAVWNITRATLTANEIPIDLLVGDRCLIVDSAAIVPSSSQKCGNGLVVDSIDDTIEATVDLTFTLWFGRAEPVDLPVGGDFDGDGVANEIDTCPLASNPGLQSIEACRFATDTGFLSDSDADLVADPADNCVWVSNENQENTDRLSKAGFNDFIGDACTEERADAEMNGSREFVIEGLPIDYTQPQNRLTYIVVEIDTENGVTCDFDSGICTVDDGAVKVCQRFDSLSAQMGCP